MLFSCVQSSARAVRIVGLTLVVCITGLWGIAPAKAQGAAQAGAQVPSFWDPQRRLEKPDLSGLRVIRFITDDDYPPFHFLGPDGNLTGFNVDLARAICDELAVGCTLQARRWDTILDTLANGQADAAVASLAMTPRTRAKVDFTAPYYRTPARFVAVRGLDLPEPTPASLSGQTVGVVARTAHEAYLRQYFPKTTLRSYDTAVALRSALKRGELKLGFTDGIASAIWLAGTDSANCCIFAGGPFTESRFFGEGVGIAVRKDNPALRRALDYALKRLSERGIYSDLYLKYFPIGFY